MRSVWWSAWVHLTLVLVLVLNVGWLWMAGLFLIPKFQKLASDGVIDLVYVGDEGLSWMPALLDGVNSLGSRYAVWALLTLALLAGLFEWRVKRHDKAFIRLSVLGTLAVGLTIVSLLVGASLTLPQLLSGPVTSRMAVTFAVAQITHLDESIKALDQAQLDKDWEAAKEPAARASQALYNLDKARPAVRALWSRQSPSEDEMRARVKEAVGNMVAIRQAIVNHDAVQMGIELGKLHQSIAPLREAAKWAR